MVVGGERGNGTDKPGGGGRKGEEVITLYCPITHNRKAVNIKSFIVDLCV